jgi:hypothetical protein
VASSDTSVTLRTEGRINTTAKSTVGRDTALYTGQITPFLGKQYSLFILDSKTTKVSQDDAFKGLNPASPNSPPEYFFETAPKVTEVGEPFATIIVPTQRGGKFVESHGSIIKTIMVRGTTGLRPRRTTNAVANFNAIGKAVNIPLVGEAVNDITQQFRLTDKQRSVPSSEQTGYDDIIFLRNLFRAYSDVKENNEASNNVLMVWRNNKDQDSWIVEPGEFKITRDSASPLTYTYTFTLQTLAPLDVSLQTVEDPLDAILTVRKVFSRVQEFNQSLRRTFLIVSTQIRRLEGLGVYAQTQLMAPIINVTKGLGIIRYTGSTFGNRLHLNAKILGDELDDAIDLLTGTPGVEPQDALVRSLRRARITVSRIIVEPGVRESIGGESSERKERYATSYITGGDLSARSLVAPDTGGSSTYIGNINTPNRVAQDIVYVGEDIRAVAGRLLKNRSAWHVLASLNGLTAPYITPDGAGDTLAPGDAVLYPSSAGGFSLSTINSGTISDAESGTTVTPVQNSYGRDIRLKSVPVGSDDVSDLYINQRGDISTVVGVPNINQAIVIKFSTERGELPVHPLFGASFAIGSKATLSSINDFRTQTESTIYSDRRIQRINKLDFTANGDVLFVQANLTVINNSDSLNLTIPLRRI